MASKRRVHVFIDGRVQGVFFRQYMKEAAQKEKVTGWVKNLPDGRVEAIFEGDANAVRRMIEWCHRGSPASRVDDVEVIEEAYTGSFNTFSIKY